MNNKEDKVKYYVLFEESQTEKEISTKDVMGVTANKDFAIAWVNDNEEYRSMKETKIVK